MSATVTFQNDLVPEGAIPFVDFMRSRADLEKRARGSERLLPVTLVLPFNLTTEDLQRIVDLVMDLAEIRDE